MSFSIDLTWKREKEFKYETFNRTHTITVGGKQMVKNSAAPEYFGDAEAANPEELLGAALSSCHMLTFLAVASKTGYVVETYNDHAVAFLNKNEEGRQAVTEIVLKPVITFSGEKKPNDEQLRGLHEKAHRNCFIANSIKTKVTIL